ncbi:hypothetical protein BGX29_003400, partial [Mortierella sp. GBA35]
MSDMFAVYEELLKSNEGDILVKLKDGKQLKVNSYLIKNRSSVFKTMLESSMQEAATRVVNLSSQYTLEAFREVMAYIYYNKTYAGSYLPLLFEILSITDYYEIDAYRTYFNDRIIALNTNLVQKFNMATWEDLRKFVVIDADGHTLEAPKLGFGVRLNNLEIDNLGRVHGEDYQYECLEMTLESGLDQLKGLKNLRVLDVRMMAQRIGIKE